MKLGKKSLGVLFITACTCKYDIYCKQIPAWVTKNPLKFALPPICGWLAHRVVVLVLSSNRLIFKTDPCICANFLFCDFVNGSSPVRNSLSKILIRWSNLDGVKKLLNFTEQITVVRSLRSILCALIFHRPGSRPWNPTTSVCIAVAKLWR